MPRTAPPIIETGGGLPSGEIIGVTGEYVLITKLFVCQSILRGGSSVNGGTCLTKSVVEVDLLPQIKSVAEGSEWQTPDTRVWLLRLLGGRIVIMNEAVKPRFSFR